MAVMEVRTPNFVSKAAADRYYRDYGFENADGQIASGAITIGPPVLGPGDVLRTDHSEGRYIVSREMNGNHATPVVSDTVQAEAERLTVTDNRIVLPTQHLKHYAELKRLLETSGGKYNSKGYFTFPAGVSVEDVLVAVREGKALNGKKVSQSFFTPAALAHEVCFAAGPLEGKRILEPSAGDGALADIALAAGAEVVVVENYPPNVLALREKGYDVVEKDFLSLTPDDLGLFDAIIANPPFTSNQDIVHVRHMFEFLKPGGILSVITSQRWKDGSQKAHQAFRDFLKSQSAEMVDVEEGAFRESGTLVATTRIQLVKSVKASDDLNLVREVSMELVSRHKPGMPQLTLGF